MVLVLDKSALVATADLKTLRGVRSVEVTRAPDGHEYRVRGTEEADLRAAIYELARQKNWPLRELRRDAKTLETVFSELAGVKER